MVYRIALLASLCACDPVPSAPDAQAHAAANPFTTHALRRSERQWRTGQVLERIAAGPYVYLRLREPSGRSEWLVSLAATTPPAHHLRALVLGRADGFHSARLGRDFSPLSFAAVRKAADASKPTHPENTP